MEYQKIKNLLEDTTHQQSKFRTRNWVELNDESWGTYNANSDIRFKTSIRSNSCDYTDAYITVKGTIIVPNTASAGATNNNTNNTNKKGILKNCASLTNCISEINNTQVDDAQDIDLVMPMYNLIEYSGVYI